MWTELQSQLRISTPTTLGLLLYKFPWLVSLHFAGQLGPEELSAAALATTVCNVAGMSISLGMSSALSTLTGQSLGRIQQSFYNGHFDRDCSCYVQQNESVTGFDALEEAANSSADGIGLDKNRNKWLSCDEPEASDVSSSVFKLLFRGIMLPYAIIVPVGVWWVFAGIKPMLILLGQEDLVSDMTQTYLRILVPGMWSYSIQWTLSAWMQALNMADIPAYAALCGLLLHIPFNILFVRVLGLGYRGVALATVLFQFIQPIIMVSYLFSNQGRRRLKSIGIRPKSQYWRELKETIEWDGITRYLRLAGPGIVLISEWWASEAVIFLGGCLKEYPEYALGTMSLYQSINTFCVMFPMGLSTACSTRVGFFLGKNDFQAAKFAYKVSMIAAVALCMLISGCLYITPHTFLPSLFTGNLKIIHETSKTIPLLAIYIIADGIQVTINGAIRGCGKQYLAMPIVVIAYWIIGVPLSYFTAFHYNLGITGLVIGITFGTWVHMLLLWIVFTSSVDWRKEAGYAQDRTVVVKKFPENLLTVYGSINNHPI